MNSVSGAVSIKIWVHSAVSYCTG